MNTSQSSPADSQGRKLLGINAYFRLVLSLILVSLFYSGFSREVLGSSNPELFSLISLLYAGLASATTIYLSFRRFWLDEGRIFVFQFCDIAILTTLMHTSGGIGSGIGYLLMFVVAMSSLLLRTQLSLLIAALATLAVLGESLSLMNSAGFKSGLLFTSGTLGILLFGSALLFSHISQRLALSQEETRVQAEETKHLQQLSQSILERMQTGVIVVNKEFQVILMNNAAENLLFNQQELPATPFQISALPPINNQLHTWLKTPQEKRPDLSADQYGHELHVNFAQLESHNQSDVLIFLEETRRISQRAQQMKLASLGRLTASIAHEIRNPVGAISHAAQLLKQETANTRDSEKRLAEIIHKHTQRVNGIIENVLQLSRRKTSEPETLNLQQWLTQFINDYQESHSENCEISFTHPNTSVFVSIDPSHLQQVLTNLFDNAVRHSEAQTNKRIISLEIEQGSSSELPYLHILDDGQGVSSKNLDKLFEPFFTTDSSGTGLGLYLAKELCLANQANLYYQVRHNKSCFTLSFAHPERQL
ncbi:MAG: hypothetical protein K6L73_00545 [Cellvibrionaceae bacterium]